MGNDSMTGPWALALGALAIGAAAVGAKLLRRRRGDDDEHPETATEVDAG